MISLNNLPHELYSPQLKSYILFELDGALIVHNDLEDQRMDALCPQA